MFRLILLLCCLLFVFTGEAANPEPGLYWKKTGENSYRLSYSGTKWAGIRWQLRLQPGTSYRISCEAQSSVTIPPSFAVSVEQKSIEAQAHSQFLVGRNWTPCVLYFYCRQPDVICRFQAIGKLSAELQLRNLQIVPLADQDFADNLLPDGNFEAGDPMPPFWRNAWQAVKYRWRTVTNSDFFAGTRNLEISFVPRQVEASGLRSWMLPVRPGHEYECRFWAKTDEKEYTICAQLQIWAQFGPHVGKHYYVMRSFKLSQEWQECTVNMVIPEEDGSIPDLRDRVVNLQFSGDPERAGRVRISEISFQEIR
ncbi:hypothetical protein [uncultured Victivallis sp.]|uniref:hypothetical protein n=1 Tax=uncultured Victivallis sp. TaxID=354118 RepID=UPI0025EB2017|nr:hypothetical protein [uncultured Victivallis sp.]